MYASVVKVLRSGGNALRERHLPISRCSTATLAIRTHRKWLGGFPETNEERGTAATTSATGGMNGVQSVGTADGNPPWRCDSWKAADIRGGYTPTSARGVATPTKSGARRLDSPPLPDTPPSDRLCMTFSRGLTPRRVTSGRRRSGRRGDELAFRTTRDVPSIRGEVQSRDWGMSTDTPTAVGVGRRRTV